MTVHNFSNRRITRSQTKNNNLEQIRSANSQEYTDKILEIKNRNDLPDKGDIEDDERGYAEDEERQNENRNSKDEEIVEENANEKSKAKPRLTIKHQVVKNNIVDSRELLFLRKDNEAYFVNTNGKPLDSDSQKRNEILSLGVLTLGQANH